MPDDRAEPLLEVRDLVKTFHRAAGMFGPKREVQALDDVGFTLRKGETLGIVGESGSGKTTLARMLLGLMEPTSGSVRYRGQDVFAMSRAEVFTFRRRMQFVFQDPTASLNPRMTVQQIISEPWAIHPEVLPREGRRARRGRSCWRRSAWSPSTPTATRTSSPAASASASPSPARWR